MKIRRCAVLYLEPREELAIDWRSVLAGGGALAASTQWLALAPHLDRELPVNAEQLTALGAISQTVWAERSECAQRHGAACIDSLLALGLLTADTDEPSLAALRERDETLRATHWRPMAALSHTFSRWRGVDTEHGMEAPTFEALLEMYGDPPPPTLDLTTVGDAVKLPGAAPGVLDEALFGRYTGRNFDLQATLPLAVAARLLQRTFGAQEIRRVGPHTSVLKKTSPSGGGLHPVEAFVLVQRVEGVPPGLYHYHPINNELRPLRWMERDEAFATAEKMLADQKWLAEAPMQFVMVGRLERIFWKYRNHQKAYRALALDAGHLSQTFYLLAAEAGLPAFITAAINDADIEEMLELDHLRHAVIAVGGCGPGHDGPRTMVELRYGESDDAV